MFHKPIFEKHPGTENEKASTVHNLLNIGRIARSETQLHQCQSFPLY